MVVKEVMSESICFADTGIEEEGRFMAASPNTREEAGFGVIAADSEMDTAVLTDLTFTLNTSLAAATGLMFVNDTDTGSATSVTDMRDLVCETVFIILVCDIGLEDMTDLAAGTDIVIVAVTGTAADTGVLDGIELSGVLRDSGFFVDNKGVLKDANLASEACLISDTGKCANEPITDSVQLRLTDKGLQFSLPNNEGFTVFLIVETFFPFTLTFPACVSSHITGFVVFILNGKGTVGFTMLSDCNS